MNALAMDFYYRNALTNDFYIRNILENDFSIGCIGKWLTIKAECKLFVCTQFKSQTVLFDP